MKILKISLLTATAFAFTGTAYAGEPYVGVSGGLTLPEDSSNRGEFTGDVPATDDFDAIPNGTPLGWETEFDNGFDISLFAGYRFDNGFRAELQGFYNENGVDTHRDLTAGGANIDDVDVAVLTRGPADPANPTVGQVIADGRGDVSNYGLMLNGYYDIDTGSAFSPYIGAGIGFQVTDVNFIPSGVDVADDDSTVFAYQLMAGATYRISDSFEIFGQYTYRDSDRADVDLNLLPAQLGVESSQSIISAGIRIPFGG